MSSFGGREYAGLPALSASGRRPSGVPLRGGYDRGMAPGDWAFVTLSINPFGGLLFAVPFAVFERGYPAWLAVLAGTPLAYVQVLAVDLAWAQLVRIGAWNRLLERLRSPRVERLMASRGNFWLTVLLTPMLGPWLLMAFMRYAHVTQRRVALPIVLGILWSASALALACVLAPRLFDR